jgi:carbonic anhydrase
MSTHDPASDAKPTNGLKGLRHWRHDLLAGLVVSMVSLPLSSGIAIASGAPPIYGIISATIAGLVFPFLGGSYVTISGPAAGLAPALLVSMAALGGAGDAEHVGAGYPFLLVVIFAVGVVQLILAKLRLARFAAIFPVSVVEGMLGAIGVLILIKALPLFFGYLGPIHAHHFDEYVGEIRHWAAEANSSALAVGVVSLAVLFLAASPWVKRLGFIGKVPPHLFAVAVGIPLAAALGLGSEFRIVVPADPLSGVQLPDFGGLFQRPELWSAALVAGVTLTLIDGVESLATAQAVDRIDPFKRRSKPDRVLAAMGLSNLLSSLVGGLTVIPGGVKSKTCIEAGGRTLWANFANAVFLLAFLFVVPGLISLIPKATLGAILIFTGWRMAHPSIARHLSHIGREQVALYAVTVVVTLFTDLLIGVLVGTVLKLVILMLYARPAGERPEVTGGFWSTLRDMFRDPVTEVVGDGARRKYVVTRPLVCFNSYKLLERLEDSQDDASQVEVEDLTVQVTRKVSVIDHTALDGIFQAMDSATKRPLRVEGMERMVRLGRNDRAVHVRACTAHVRSRTPS